MAPSELGGNSKTSYKFAALHSPELALVEDPLYTTLAEETQHLVEEREPWGRTPDDAKGPSVCEYFDPRYEWAPGTEVALCNRIRRTMRPTTQDGRARPFSFTVEPKLLRFQAGELEPFFCSLALYDSTTRKKISETFHFHRNSPALMGLLGEHYVSEERPSSLLADGLRGVEGPC